MRLALIHYLYPPTVGGVERVVAEHAALFAGRGHRVTVLCGGGESREPGVEVRVIPELRPGRESSVGEVRRLLESALAGVEVVFVHNLMTMPFNLAATGALAEMAAAGFGRARFVNWIHDLAAVNPDYTLDATVREPLGRARPGFRNVAVSASRQREFVTLTGIPPEDCPVIPNGIDAVKVLGLTPAVDALERRHRLLGRELVLLQPARILRRKNIELGLAVTAALRSAGRDAFYLVTGAPDPHNPASAAYGDALRAASRALGVDGNIAFAGADGAITDADLGSLYALADAVFLPSRQEGFGLPVLEAALLRLPVFCADREPMRALLPGRATLFDPEAAPAEIASRVLETLAASAAFQARKETLDRYRWDAIYDRHIAPLCLEIHPYESGF